MSNTKKEGQIFTPQNIVSEMLDGIGFYGEITLSARIMEPSFGEGAFLVEVIKRIIKEGKKKKLSAQNISTIICNNVYGIEKDSELYKTAISNIKETLKQNGIDCTERLCNLYNGDTLTMHKEFKHHFDYIVGNPPYVRRKNIDNIAEVKKLSFAQKGMCDLYVAFFDMSIQMLNEIGKLCFITPNSYFNIATAKEMRKYIIENQLLAKIKNFEHKQVFDNATTYCCITYLDKTKQTPDISYETQDQTKIFKYEDFYIKEQFLFSNVANIKDIIEANIQSICTVKNGCATLWDDFFIGSEIANISHFSIPIIKASTGKQTSCFFPYDDKGDIIPIEEIQAKDEKAFEILLKNESRLRARSIEKPALWYGFGRSQALKDVNKNKYAINNLYKNTNDITIIECKKGCAVYGGLYILTDLTLEEMTKILVSNEYMEYVKSLGKYKSGGYYTISSKEMEQFINYQYRKNINKKKDE